MGVACAWVLTAVRELRFLLPICVCSFVLLGACASPQSTRLRNEDLSATATEMAAKLQAAAFMQDRGPSSPPMIVAITKVENLTTDLIPSSEQWYLMAKVRDSLPIMNLRQQRHLYFVIPAEHLREGVDRGNLPVNFGYARAPTHELAATFRSARRTASLDQTDAYLCEYRMTEIASGELVWSDTVQLKKSASGKAYD